MGKQIYVANNWFSIRQWVVLETLQCRGWLCWRKRLQAERVKHRQEKLIRQSKFERRQAPIHLSTDIDPTNMGPIRAVWPLSWLIRTVCWPKEICIVDSTIQISLADLSPVRPAPSMSQVRFVCYCWCLQPLQSHPWDKLLSGRFADCMLS